MVDVNKLLGQFMDSGFAGGMAGTLAYTAYQRFSHSERTTVTSVTFAQNNKYE